MNYRKYINNPESLEPLRQNAVNYHCHFGAEATADIIWQQIIKKYPHLAKKDI